MKKNLFIALTVLLSTGCSSNFVSESSLKDRAAFALGVHSSKVTISNKRADGLVKINFDAKVGKKNYQCYVTTVMGAATSDAICSGTNGNSKVHKKCNALLKAAGKC